MTLEAVGAIPTIGLGRRQALFAGGAVLAGVALCAPVRLAAARNPTAFEGELAALERRAGGRLGVFALDLTGGDTLAYRADQRFKLYSTFKGLLAALVLHDVDHGRERLDAPVRFGSSDLLPASPITTAAVARGVLSVRDLCEAIMYRSDNTAANLLMARRGGPARLTALLRATGDPTTRVDSYEGRSEGRPIMFDTTTPAAIVATERRILLGKLLSPASRDRWQHWMTGNVVGRSRLRAAFPDGWIVGDRTGTGDGICNDLAFALRPDRRPLLVSAYYAAPGMELDAQEAVLRDVGAVVVRWQDHRAG